MPEPSRPQVRPIGMVRALMMAVLLVLTGCGSAGKSTGEGAGSDQQKGSSMVGDCSASSAQVTQARSLASVDLDGDGTA